MYDTKNLGKLKALDANAPEAMQAFWAFDKAAMAAGSISSKNKELIALAVAFTTQCPYCIEIHAKRARHGTGACRGGCGCGGASSRRGNHAWLSRYGVVA
jgi:AhpD family alkylhydroperoxidase